MRGYFAIGVEGISKPLNLGNLFRSAHAFGASWVFTIAAHHTSRRVTSDTSDAGANIPRYEYATPGDLQLPSGCALVGVELLDEAVELPSFPHPRCAAYVLGRERGSLSPQLVARCDHLVRIPTSFCINLATAGAVVMYDRLTSLGRFAVRPVSALARPTPLPPHVAGGQKMRRSKANDG